MTDILQPLEAFQHGAIPEAANTRLRRQLGNLAAGFPVAVQHRQNFRNLGCEFVYAAAAAAESRFRDCWLVLIRLGTILEERFGVSSEIPAIYSPHADIQSRTINSIGTMLSAIPSDRQGFTKGVVFFWAPDSRLFRKLEDFSNGDRLLIPLVTKDDPYLQLTAMANRMYSRNLFRERSFVTGDQFFGRHTLLRALESDIKNGQVPGVFGTRKTGKTSAIKELARASEEAKGEVRSIYVYQDLEHLSDASFGDPAIELVADLAEKTREAFKSAGLRTNELAAVKPGAGPLDLLRALDTILKRPDMRNIELVVLLDEVEHLCPPGSESSDPNESRLRVSQLLGVLRKLLQERHNFKFVLAGLATASVEAGLLFGRPNPLFAFAHAYYAEPFHLEETAELLTGIGRRIGIDWSENAIREVQHQTGGNVVLIRELAAEIVGDVPSGRLSRYEITDSLVTQSLDRYIRSVSPIVKEILDHVKRFYSDAWDLMDMLVSDPVEFNAMAEEYIVEVNRLARLGLIVQTDDRSWHPSKILELGRKEFSPRVVTGGSNSIADLDISSTISAGETHTIEFKSSCSVAIEKPIPESAIAEEVVITVLGFWNADGGTLLVGVRDDGEVLGIDRDIQAKGSIDKLIRWISGKLNAVMGNAAASMVHVGVVQYAGLPILCIVTPRGSKPIWPIAGMKGKEHYLFVRQAIGTQAMSGREASQYEHERWA